MSAGFRSLFAFWLGGAGVPATVVVPPSTTVEQVDGFPPISGKRRRGRRLPIDLELEQELDDEELLILLHTL